MEKTKTVLIWFSVQLLSLIFLIGRYDWSNSFSVVSYVISAFFLLVSLPVFYFTLLHFLGHRWRLTLGITIILATILTLPYHWLGLEIFSINNTFSIPQPSSMVVFDWFPNAFKSLPAIPYEGGLFYSLAIIGIFIALILRSWRKFSKRLIWTGLFLFIIILIQVWLHLSLRSPYSYAGSLSGPNRWSVFYLFPGDKGAVNNDYPVHRAIEGIFMGIPGYLLLIRRAYYYYLTSQLSYFVHPYYVSLILNIGFWFCAAICGYGFVRRIWDEHTALITAGLIACGTGFIYFVAQPMSYMAGYALCIILVYLFQALIIDQPNKIGQSLLFGAILGLSSLVYDGLLPIYIFIICYGLFRRIKLFHLLCIVFIGISIYFGFIFLVSIGLRQSIDPYPFSLPVAHVSKRIDLILSGNINQLYLLFTQLIVLFFGGLGNAFFVLPLILSLFGLMLVYGNTRKMIILLLLALPLFWTATYHFGDVTFNDSLSFSTMPRYLYIGYPAIYILSALFIRKISDGFIRIKNHTFKVGAFIGYIILFCIFLLNNIDVFGFQSFYYLFYFLAPTLQK